MTSQTDQYHEIVIDINVDGTVEAEIEGIKGKDCEGILENLLRDLGTVEEHRNTREYHQTPRRSTRRRTRRREDNRRR